MSKISNLLLNTSYRNKNFQFKIRTNNEEFRPMTNYKQSKYPSNRESAILVWNKLKQKYPSTNLYNEFKLWESNQIDLTADALIVVSLFYNYFIKKN